MRNTHTADAASTAASMHPVRGMPIGLLISIGVIASMLVVAATILLLGWNSARSALMDTAQRTAHDTGQLINARARVLLEPTQSTLRQISFDPIADASTLTERLQRLYVLSEDTIHQPDDLGDLCGL